AGVRGPHRCDLGGRLSRLSGPATEGKLEERHRTGPGRVPSQHREIGQRSAHFARARLNKHLASYVRPPVRLGELETLAVVILVVRMFSHEGALASLRPD